MKKGFTLIELLAVIVILAIIALIATPIILGIIEDARAEAKVRSAELAVTGVEYAITQYMYNQKGNTPKDIDSIKEYFSVENVELTGSSTSGTIKEEGATDDLCTVTVNSGVFNVSCLANDPKNKFDKAILATK